MAPAPFLTPSQVEHAASNALDKVVHHGSRHGDRHGTHRSPRVSTEATASTPRSESASSHQSVEVPESKDLLELEERKTTKTRRKGGAFNCSKRPGDVERSGKWMGGIWDFNERYLLQSYSIPKRNTCVLSFFHRCSLLLEGSEAWSQSCTHTPLAFAQHKPRRNMD